MRRAVVALAAAVAVATAVHVAQGGSRHGVGAVREVSMPGRVYAPGRIQVLLGDTVVWRNSDATNHTVTSDDDLFSSGFISPGLTFAHAFAKTGTFLYHCTIHKTMRGEVVVVPVALIAPHDAVSSGARIVLQGFAPTGTSRVTVRRLRPDTRVMGRAVPAGDGSFTVQFRIYEPADFSALARGLASPRVHVAVSPRVLVRRNGGTVAASASPKRPGARAVLQRYVRERFAWRTISRTRLDGSSKATLGLPKRPGRFRVVVRGSKGWADGISSAVVVKRRAS